MTDQEKPSILTYLIYEILFTNDLVCDEITLAYHDIKQSPLFRHQIKALAKKLLGKSNEYKRNIVRVVGKENTVFLADSNDIYNGEVDKHVQILRITSKTILDKHNVPNSNIIAHWHLIYTLSQIAQAVLLTANQALIDLKVNKSFAPLSIAPILRLSKHMNDALYTGPDIDFTKDENYALAVKVLTKKLCNPDIITKAICKDEQL